MAEQLLQSYPRIDVLANNAGRAMRRREVTIDGHETTFQVDYLAAFLLTTLLMDPARRIQRHGAEHLKRGQ